MSEIRKSAVDFIGYEYKVKTVDSDKADMYLDCYQNFGWIPDKNVSFAKGERQTTIRIKRDRKIINKAELTRLQRNFEACVQEIRLLEKSKTASASLWAIVTGVVGTCFMAGSTFAVTHEPPFIWLCIVLAVPGFAGWTLPCFLYRRIVRNKTEKVTPLVEQKFDEIYEICEKGNQMLIEHV